MVQLLQAFGAFRGAMTLIGLNLVSKYATNSFKNEMAKSFITEGGSSSAKGDVSKLTASNFELIMMSYFWSWFVKPEKLKNIMETREKMTKELDIGKTFDKLDQINANDLEEQLKAGIYGKN